MEYEGRKFVEAPPYGSYKTTLNVIPHHMAMLAQCRACGVTRELDREALNSKAGIQDWLPEIEKRLRCSACGANDAKLMLGYFGS